MSTGAQNQIFDILLKVLGYLAVPLFLWGISQHMEVSYLKKDVQQLQETMREWKKMQKVVEDDSRTILLLEEKLRGVHEDVAKIRELLVK